MGLILRTIEEGPMDVTKIKIGGDNGDMAFGLFLHEEERHVRGRYCLMWRLFDTFCHYLCLVIQMFVVQFYIFIAFNISTQFFTSL